MTTNTRPSGMDLKLKRVALRIKQTELARAMGVSPSRLCNIEEAAVVTDKAAARYLAALDTWRTSDTSEEAAS